MCTAPAALAAVALVGTAVSAYGQYQAGQTAKKAARAQEQAQLRQALETEEQGKELAERRRKQAADQRARARVAFAAAGIDPDADTAGTVQEEISRVSREEEAQIRRGAKRQALGLREQAAVTAFEGEQAATAGRINAAGTLISGAGTVASRWYANAGAGGRPKQPDPGFPIPDRI